MLSSPNCEDQVSVYSRSLALVAATKLDSSCHVKGSGIDSGKYVRYTAEQVQALERLYNECPKPSSLRRQQLMRENPILQNIEPKQIKVWFQNRRCREKQRKESSRLQTVNTKLSAMNKLLMEENDRLQKQAAQLVYENGYLRQQLQQGGITTDTSCDSVVTSGLQHLPTPQQSPDATYSGILSVAEEILAEFLGKATGTAVDWVQMSGMKPGPDSTEMINISHGFAGVAARACGLVGMEAPKVVEVLRDKTSWNRCYRRLTTMLATSTGSGGTIEVLYTQTYAPTTLAPARDFYTLRYTAPLEDGSYVVCERSINPSHVAPVAPEMPPFIRAEMQASGYLIRPCDGTGCIVILVDHMDLEPLTVPEVLRPLYESSAVLAHNFTIPSLRYLRHLAQESLIEAPGGGQQPAAVRSLSHRLAKGFNDAVNAFVDDGWMPITSDGVDDINIMVKVPSVDRDLGVRLQTTHKGIMCVKASMLLQNVLAPFLVRFLHEHRSEWADTDLEEAMQMGNPGLSGCHSERSNSQILQPQIHTVEQDEFLELIKMEGCNDANSVIGMREALLLQLCSGLNGKTGVGACAQLVFAPIDASISEDIELMPSGFRVIPLESRSMEKNDSTRTLDLASALDVVGGGATAGSNIQGGNMGISSKNSRSVLSMAFQINYEIHMQESAASMARLYVRNVVSTVQRVALALAPCPPALPLPPPPHMAALTSTSHSELDLAHWICKSYKMNVGMDLVHWESERSEDYFKALWKLGEAVVCCTCKAAPVYTFANKVGLEMLETCSTDLPDVPWENTLDHDSPKGLHLVLGQVMQQGYALLPEGVGLSSKGRAVSYEQGIAWKVVMTKGSSATAVAAAAAAAAAEEDLAIHGVAFLFANWCFLNDSSPTPLLF